MLFYKIFSELIIHSGGNFPPKISCFKKIFVFFCVSGFTYSYDASAPVGQRVYVLPLKGESLTLAISSEYASGDKVCIIVAAVAIIFGGARYRRRLNTER